MNQSTPCRSCGRPIPVDAPQGICPTCVFGLLGNANRTMNFNSAHSAETPSLAEISPAFPQLEILESIGQGGMGAVYRVRQKGLDRIAALKLLNVRLANDPLFQERFTREAKLMARLLHPNIATIFEFGQSGDFCFLLMEFIDGVNLREAIRTKSTTPEEALRIIPQICDALQYAHDQGVIHRDVKPENVLLDKYGRVKLVDFGLAKLNVSSPDQISLTGTQQIMGTMNYMAPEQREQSRAVDHRADIYSLGVVFYELLTGELPLGKFSEPSLRANSNQRLDPVVMRTLEKDPNARYQSANDVKTAVNAVSHFANGSESRPNEWTTWSKDEPALPFWFGSSSHEAWQSFGMAQLKSTGLELEYHRRNKWWGTDDGIGKTVIPYEEISSIRMKTGPLTRGIEIQTRSLRCLADLPFKKEAGLLLQTKSKDAERRGKFYEGLCSAVGQKPVYGLNAQQLESVRSRLKGPTRFLWVSAMVNLFFGLIAFCTLGVLLWTFFFEEYRSIPNLEENSISLGITAPMFSAIDLFQLFALYRLQKLNDYWIGVAGCITSLAPLHPGWVVGFPAGIWGLVTLSDEICYSAFDSNNGD